MVVLGGGGEMSCAVEEGWKEGGGSDGGEGERVRKEE